MKATSYSLSKRRQPMKEENEDKSVLTETGGGSKIQVTFSTGQSTGHNETNK